MECQYCKGKFISKQVLLNHQKRAKYCLLIQTNINTNTNVISELIKCQYCELEMVPNHLQRHHNRCIKRFETLIIEKDNIIKDKDKLIIKILKEKDILIIENETIIKEKEKEIDKQKVIIEKEKYKLIIEKEIYKELGEHSRKVVEEIAKQPRNQKTNVTNQTTNNLNMLTPMDMNVEDFGKIINDSFTKDYLLNGQKGAARFTVDKILKDSDGKLKYVCTDTSRQIYRFKTPDGLVQKDFKANKLSSVLVDNLTKKSHSITSDEIEKNSNADVFVLYTNNFQDIRDMSQDNGDFRTELAVLTSV